MEPRRRLLRNERARRWAAAALAACVAAAAAPARAAGSDDSARSRAPIDITGHWVSLITGDWAERMLTPRKGDYADIPLNAEGRRIANAWDPAQDTAAGEQCKGYAAPAIMRLPSRIDISWQDANTLELAIDTGMQTRTFHFGTPAAQGPRTWQGWSTAEWQTAPQAASRAARAQPEADGRKPASYGSLKVDTAHLRAGYLRKNGVPFSQEAQMTEYYNLVTDADGTQYLIVQTFISDPKYLSRPFVRTSQFKREPDASKRRPTACSAS
jgi:hypothetical protein